MKNFNKLPMAITFLVIFMVPIFPSYGSVVPSLRGTEPPRYEVVWSTGGEGEPNTLNPWANEPEPMSQLMLETLFGYNSKDQVYVPCIETDFEWLNGGLELHININLNARWSNGYPISAFDVIKSYQLAYLQPKWGVDFPKRFNGLDAFEKANETGVIFNVRANSTYSKRVMTWISSNVPILPWYGIYEEINATYADAQGNLMSFTNDWFSRSYPREWKVCSGPYSPVYRDAAKTTAVYQRRTDWWGNSTTIQLYSDLPNWNVAGGAHPKYVGHRKISSGKDSAFRAGQVDLHAGYYEEMWKDFTNDDTKFLNYSEGWYGTDEPYQVAISSIVSVAFNHEYGTPLNESWFRDAIGYMINYDPIPDAAASGYTRRACATFIDNVSSTQMIYYNETLDAAYRRSYNPSQAAAILTAHGCTGTVGGSWLLPDGVTPIGPFTMICPAGWSDVRVFSEYVCSDITDFGITVTFDGIDVDAIGWAAWTALWTTCNYEFGMSCGCPKVTESPEVFLNGWRAFKDWNNNITGWNTAKAWEYDALYKQLETENDPVRYQYLLDEIQRIFCEETPELPCFVNGYWYTTSSYYWDGWCNANNEYQQIITEWTNDAIPMKTRLILNLVSTGISYPAVLGGFHPFMLIAPLILIGTIGILLIYGFIKLVSWTISKFKPYNNYPN